MRNRRVLVFLGLSNVAGQRHLAGIFQRLRGQPGVAVEFIRDSDWMTEARFEKLLGRDCDGVIVGCPGLNAERRWIVEKLIRRQIPTVAFEFRDPPPDARHFAVVNTDNRQIGEAAALHFHYAGGFRTFAYVHAPERPAWSRERAQEFAAQLRRLESVETVNLDSPADVPKLPRPAAVFAANDDCAYSVLEACRAARRRVPQDVAVLGVDNDALICENAEPKISTIEPDFERDGGVAAELLLQLMRRGGGKMRPPALIKSRRLVQRGSTGKAVDGKGLCAMAMEYVREQAFTGISVDDVAHHLHVSRRLLDLRFREARGTTLGESILNFRLDEVRRLLRETDEPLDEIAARCGYCNPNYLRNLFRRRFVITPSAYRAAHRRKGAKKDQGARTFARSKCTRGIAENVNSNC